jgi:hypothetical protein
VNEWSDVKAGQYLAVFLKDDAKAFYHQQSHMVKKSYKRTFTGFEREIRGIKREIPQTKINTV